MLKIEHTEVYGWEAAIRGMRNPMNSWDKSDSYATYIEDPQTMERAQYQYFIGDADKQLMLKLAAGGPVHAKYRRMIVVTLDIDAPLYWWKEFETYRTGVIPNPVDLDMNSCSTMHKLDARPLVLDDFSHEHLFGASLELLKATIKHINDCRESYVYLKSIGEDGRKCWENMIQLLPTSYNQKRTLMLNYEVLVNIYKWRRHHKLDEWHTFCDWIESLPHSDIIIGEVSK